MEDQFKLSSLSRRHRCRKAKGGTLIKRTYLFDVSFMESCLSLYLDWRDITTPYPTAPTAKKARNPKKPVVDVPTRIEMNNAPPR